MIQIDWILFLQMIPFMLVGLFIYILGKYALAYSRKDFDRKVFVKRNKLAFILGLSWCVVGCYLYSRGIGLGISQPPDVVAIILGISGGSLGKGTVKILSAGKRV
jgi:hypothetical protein